MASLHTQRPMNIQNENMSILHKKSVITSKEKNTGTTIKKGGRGLGSRKALNDITNKSTTGREASLKKSNVPKEEINISDEMFLHDHSECVKSTTRVEASSKPEASLKKGNVPEEEINIAEEMFLHDHSKCIKEQKREFDRAFVLDTLFPQHGFLSSTKEPGSKKDEMDLDSPQWYPESPMADFSNGFELSATRPPSPLNWDSPPVSPFAWPEPVEFFVLKPEI